MVSSHFIVAEPTRITLRYRGRDVDDGTMPVDDVVDALQGFAGAYGKVAAQVDPTHVHQIKVTAIKKHSFDVLLLAGMFLADKIKELEPAIDATKFVLRTIIDIINIKKHTKGTTLRCCCHWEQQYCPSRECGQSRTWYPNPVV